MTLLWLQISQASCSLNHILNHSRISSFRHWKCEASITQSNNIPKVKSQKIYRQIDNRVMTSIFLFVPHEVWLFLKSAKNKAYKSSILPLKFLVLCRLDEGDMVKQIRPRISRVNLYCPRSSPTAAASL